MRSPNRKLQITALLGSVALLSGCGSGEDPAYTTATGAIAAHRAGHPHYPVIAFDDFGDDNGPIGIPVDVYSFYCHATTKPNALAAVASVDETSRRLANVFGKAIKSLIVLEASTPAPHAPFPSTPEWKQAPHPASGSYQIVVGNGAKTLSFLIRCPVQTGESSDQAVERVAPQLLADAKQVVAEHAKLEEAEMKSFKPPPGFTLATQEMLDLQQGNRGVEPHQIGDPLCLTPLDRALAMAALDHSIKKILTLTARINPKPETAHLLIKGPGLDGVYAIPLAAGKEHDHAVASAESQVGNRLDELNRKAS